MVQKLSCDCKNRIGTQIDTFCLFEEIKRYFEEQVHNDIFVEERPVLPYYTWTEMNRRKEWYASKWYRCRQCGCLWEVQYPDFPANGFVRKFEDGIYHEKE